MPELRSEARRARAAPSNPIIQPEGRIARSRRGANGNRGSAAEEEIKLLEEADRKMEDYESGGRSADKTPAAEEEGSTAPLPEKVLAFLCNRLKYLLI